MSSTPSQRIGAVLGAIGPFLRFATDSEYARRVGDPGVADFAFGNPQEMPLPGFVQALQTWSVPQSKDWFAYKLGEAGPRATIAATLAARHGLPFDPDDIFLTNGAFAALAVSLCALVDPGDEVIFISPPWFFYEALIL